MAKQEPAYKTEAEMCADFIAAIGNARGGDSWTPYPETAGFDILLVRLPDGFQIGVEAKLKLNAVVLSQALEGWDHRYRDDGPDCRAVLVPEDAVVAGIPGLLPHLAVTAITMRSGLNWRYNARFVPDLPKIAESWGYDDWHELCPMKRCALPDYVPDVAAGASAPVQLTDWKIRAIKIAVLVETRGYVTRADFRALKIDVRRWIDGDWLRADAKGLVAGAHCPEFKRQHPKVYEQIKAEIETWAPDLQKGLLV